MSEICEVCGRKKGIRGPAECEGAREGDACLRLGYERTLARADCYEAEFSACKALLIAAEARAEEAERRAREAEEMASLTRADCRTHCDKADAAASDAEDRADAAEQRASEARAALERAANALMSAGSDLNHAWAQERPPSKESADDAYAAEDAARAAHSALAALPVEPGAARSTSEPAPQNPPPSPTGDAE